ncbi:MAG: hypothetical protein UU73_C0003G0196 [Candidatus Daviesbacteria bacterium GW2011_GWA1_41_61]|uniref:Uncharacterized protein n=1 Tax=Candidatus Daviesbacteria bacterium GW2011_GWA2_40_9 TaxID=1618424 RepID=A0A0G0WHN2_9BACT|nr:MAG: hypothetical protein UU26_C0003G0030 [Candidatus Daviesbacteria bacterium GW2011_GWC1_40_9]KKR83845.1 MAG: hypothetical protein UU29_C0001G0065 [Candidatus Daviesbacteria bacterium GW2011_GWA2_40_9]KKR93454.1 MAG: hypothetical protein UU44_C0002G0115 [Candidatus Daviesbacteria bacterium GW2011_GWB1_41_15]KKS14997.1 MAG: hypothetical protein UU73_C0003G0196 [Candidatus Daviesbacteria bacterium GW2011_GWA1_41_61]
MKGLTLVEMLIVTAAALIVGVMLVTLLVNNSGFFYKQSSIIDQGLSLNEGLQEIDKNIRQAVKVAVGYPEDSPLYTTSSQTLVLKMPALGPSEVISDTYDYTVVNIDAAEDKILRLQVFPNPLSTRKSQSLVLTKALSSITFNYLDNNDTVVSANIATQVEVILSILENNGPQSSFRTSKAVTSLRN